VVAIPSAHGVHPIEGGNVTNRQVVELILAVAKVIIMIAELLLSLG
jgi:hypothetical protein